MNGHRINERNTGHTTLEGTLKVRKISKRISEDESTLAKAILQKVYDSMEREQIGFTDGGRFTLLLDRTQMYSLCELIKKL